MPDYQLHALACGVSAGVLVLFVETLLIYAWTKRKTLYARIFSRLRHFHAKPDQLTRKRISDREKRLCAFYGRIANEKKTIGEPTMKTMKVKLTFTEEVLGTASADPEIHREFIASKAPDAPTIEDEVAAVGVDEVAEKSTTIFPRDENGNPFVYDYQIKGFFKDACGVLRRVSDSKSAKLKAYKKEIDGLVFVIERATPFLMDGEPITELGTCQRPLRAETAQGARVALASSETVPAGATVEFTVQVLKDDLLNLVREWLDYGALRGLGQWRNSGKGRFTWCECE